MVNQEKTADSLLEQADLYFKKNKMAEAFDVYKEVFELARKEFNRSVEVEALSQLARTKLRVGELEEGQKYLDMAQERATESDPLAWSRFLGVKGRFQWKSDKLDLARNTFSAMFDFCNSNGLWGRTVDAANMMAIVSESPEEQIQWCQKGIEAAEAADEESLLAALWNNLGSTYYDVKQYDSALACYEKSREYHWRFSGEYAKLFADYHIGMTLRLLGRVDEALTWLRPVLAWAERLDAPGAIGQACEDMGEIEVVKGNKSEGLKYLKRAREEYKRAGYNENWPEIWENINNRIKAVEG